MSTIPPGGQPPSGPRPDTSGKGEAQDKQQAPKRQPVSNVSDKEVKQFAAALGQIQKLHSEAASGKGGPGGGDGKEAAAPDTESMRRVIQDSGLSVNRYNRISEALRQDSDLQERVKKELPKD